MGANAPIRVQSESMGRLRVAGQRRVIAERSIGLLGSLAGSLMGLGEYRTAYAFRTEVEGRRSVYFTG